MGGVERWWGDRLELEVDEGLEVGGDELAEEEYDEGYHHGHPEEGEAGEGEAIAAFEALREPVDNHSNYK